MYKAYTDGGCRPNPGKGAFGYLIYDDLGKELKRENGFVGENVTNNIAEYTAIIKALKAAISMGIKHLTVYTDSQLVIKHLSGDYKVQEPRLKGLYNEVLSIMEQIEKVEFVQIRRNQNKLADALTGQYYSKASMA